MAPLVYRGNYHALSAGERATLVSVTNEARFWAVPPARIVPMLIDEGVYLAVKPVLHGDNRSTLTATTVLAMLD